MAPARCDVSIEGLSRVSDLVMVGLLLIRACSSLRLVDGGRIGVQVEVSDLAVARRLSVKPGLSSMRWGGLRGQRPQLGRVIESWGPPSGRAARSGRFRHRIDPELAERAVKGEKAARVDGEVLLLDDPS